MQKTKINTAVVQIAETTEQTKASYELPEGRRNETLGNICSMYQPKTTHWK